MICFVGVFVHAKQRETCSPLTCLLLENEVHFWDNRRCMMHWYRQFFIVLTDSVHHIPELDKRRLIWIIVLCWASNWTHKTSQQFPPS
jgi:hypothetical protein